MKIYILRHEDRTQDATMFSPLTKTGLDNAVELIDTIKDLDINIIYSSPFIRTLQTIYPYAKENNKKINVDYSLSEFQHESIIPKNSYSVRLPEYIAESFNCNNNYKTLFEPENFEYPEDEHKLNKRVKSFLTKLMKENLEKKCNILLVTHQAVCNSILKIATKYIDDVNIEFTYSYPKGKVTKVWDVDEWYFKPINWNYE